MGCPRAHQTEALGATFAPSSNRNRPSRECGGNYFALRPYGSVQKDCLAISLDLAEGKSKNCSPFRGRLLKTKNIQLRRKKNARTAHFEVSLATTQQFPVSLDTTNIGKCSTYSAVSTDTKNTAQCFGFGVILTTGERKLQDSECSAQNTDGTLFFRYRHSSGLRGLSCVLVTKHFPRQPHDRN